MFNKFKFKKRWRKRWVGLVLKKKEKPEAKKSRGTLSLKHVILYDLRIVDMEAAGVPRLLRVVNPHPPAGQADGRVNRHLRHVPDQKTDSFSPLELWIWIRISCSCSCVRLLRYIFPSPSLLSMRWIMISSIFGLVSRPDMLKSLSVTVFS